MAKDLDAKDQGYDDPEYSFCEVEQLIRLHRFDAGDEWEVVQIYGCCGFNLDTRRDSLLRRLLNLA